MQSADVQTRETLQPEISNEVKTEVSPAMRVAEDTEGVTDEFFAKSCSANQELRTPSADHTSAQSIRVNPDSGTFIRIVIAGVAFAGLVAFGISFVSLYAVAEWLGLPPWMWWAVPTFIDLAILVYAAFVLVHRARGEKTWPSWCALGAFTLLSVIANGAHALSHEHDAQWQAYIGVLIAAMVPIAIFVATEQLSRAAIADLNSRKSEMRDQLELETYEAEQRQKREELEFEAEQRRRERERQRLDAQREQELAQRQHELELTGLHSEKTVSATQNGRYRDTETVNIGRPMAAAQPIKRPTKKGDDELVAYLQDQVEAGHEITGNIIAEFLGVSARTGRRRIKELQEQHPELFASQDADDESTVSAEPQTES